VSEPASSQPHDRARKITPGERVDADPSPGITREQAIAAEPLWAGLVRTAPGVASGWHHHGDYESSIYVARGSLRIQSGPGGRDLVEASVGDFVHVPKGAIHREMNDGNEESHLVVVRAGHGVPTVNVKGPAPEEPSDSAGHPSKAQAGSPLSSEPEAGGP
jgi:uncharacterized RmlC-like cupin family protein